MNLKGRTAIVTGGAGHVGSAIADAVAELGAAVAIVDFQESQVSEVCESLRTRYAVKTASLVVDLADEHAVRGIPTRVVDALGGVDILINCAALVGVSALEGWATGFLDQSSATWRRALEVNLTAPFVLTQACTPALRESKHGTVINIGYIYGMVGPDMDLYTGTRLGNPAAYAASKGGLIQLTRWLSTTLAPCVRANSISLGGVWRNQPESFHAKYTARTPLGRMATEEDVKGAVAYLSSDLSAYVTGQNLVVDGGWTAW